MPRNPYINLLATAWRYARGEKKDYVRLLLDCLEQQPQMLR